MGNTKLCFLNITQYPVLFLCTVRRGAPNITALAGKQGAIHFAIFIQFVNSDTKQLGTARCNGIDMNKLITNFAPIATILGNHFPTTANHCALTLRRLLHRRCYPLSEYQAEQHNCPDWPQYPGHQFPGMDACRLHNQQLLAGGKHTQTDQGTT